MFVHFGSAIIAFKTKHFPFFISGYCGETMLKPCTQTGLCGASQGCLGAYVPGSGLLQAPHWFFHLLVAGCFFRRQSSVQRHVRPLLFFPVSHSSCSNFFQASRQFAVAFGFRHYWGVCLHLLLWSLLSHFFFRPVP